MVAEHFIASTNYEPSLLQCWIDVGLAVGHLKRKANQLVASKRMTTYFIKNQTTSVGDLLNEMLDMHIPTLLEYPALLHGKAKKPYEGDVFGQTVAATSALIQGRAYPFVKKQVSRNRTTRILDIGCGTGGYLIDLAKLGFAEHYVGIDINEDVISSARTQVQANQLNGVSFRCTSFENYASEQPFQLIMLNNVLHYYSMEQRKNLIKKACELLLPGGTLLIITPLYMETRGKRFSTAFNAFMMGHSNLYALPRKKELIELAEEVGLACPIVKAIISEGSWHGLIFKK
jgi:SAM-dependent methyltransferase